MRIALYYIIFGAVFGFMLAFLFKGCGKPKTVTVSKTDTLYVKVSDTIETHPTVEVVQGGKIPDGINKDSVVIKYYQTIIYKDTGRTRYGTIVRYDTVSQNELRTGPIVTNFQIPVTTTTVQTPPKNQLFIGINAIGSQKSFIEGFGPSAMFKLKNGKTIEAGAYLRPDGGIMYEIGLKTLIRLK